MKIWAILMVLGVMGTSFGENWPHFRGPAWDGTSSETGLPDKLTAGSILWKLPLPGIGAGTAVVWGERVFVSAADPNSKEILAYCVNAGDGQVVWRKVVGQVASIRNVAACSAVTDGKIVVFLYGTGEIAAYNVDGKALWQKNLGDIHGKFDNKFVYGASPLLYGGHLYIFQSQCVGRREKDKARAKELGLDPLDLGESYLVCLEPGTGRQIFKMDRQVKANGDLWDTYSSPVPARLQGREVLLTIGASYLMAHNPGNGKELWRWRIPYTPKTMPSGRYVPSPCWSGELVYIQTPMHNPLYALKTPTEPNDAPAWTWKTSPDVSSMVVYGGRLYMLNGQGKSLTCFGPADGKVIWEKRLDTEQIFESSPTVADGKIYLVSKAGEVLVVAAEKYQELSRLNLGEKEVQASVAIAGGRLYVHAPKMLYCIK